MTKQKTLTLMKIMFPILLSIGKVTRTTTKNRKEGKNGQERKARPQRNTFQMVNCELGYSGIVTYPSISRTDSIFCTLDTILSALMRSVRATAIMESMKDLFALSFAEIDVALALLATSRAFSLS